MIKDSFLVIDEFIDFWINYINEHPNDEYKLYIHYPWCRSLCKYCVYGKLISPSDPKIINRYEKVMINLFHNHGEDLFKAINENNITLSNIFFGGGTPTLWKDETLYAIMDTLKDLKIEDKLIEYHPADLSFEKLNFYIHQLGFTSIDIGIQSFDINANKCQNRFIIDPIKLAEYVKYIENQGAISKCDLIAFYNGDEEKDWEIFKEDMDKMINIVSPGTINITVNYNSKNYYHNQKRLRKYLMLINLNTRYKLEYSVLGLDYDSILDFGPRTYMLIRNDLFPNICGKSEKYKKRAGYKGVNCIAFGGIRNMECTSYISNGHSINSLYIPNENEFVFHYKNFNFFEIGSFENSKFNAYNKKYVAGNGIFIRPFSEEEDIDE